MLYINCIHKIQFFLKSKIEKKFLFDGLWTIRLFTFCFFKKVWLVSLTPVKPDPLYRTIFNFSYSWSSPWNHIVCTTILVKSVKTVEINLLKNLLCPAQTSCNEFWCGIVEVKTCYRSPLTRFCVSSYVMKGTCEEVVSGLFGLEEGLENDWMHTLLSVHTPTVLLFLF